MPLNLHLYHVGVFTSSDLRFDHLMKEYHLHQYHHIIDLPLLISRVNFLDIFIMVDGVLDILKSFWVVSISFTNSMISSTCHSSIWFSNDLKWFFDFDFREGFCQRRRNSTIIALNAIFFSGDSCIQSIINLEISSMKFFSTCPDGNKNRFFLQYTIYS